MRSKKLMSRSILVNWWVVLALDEEIGFRLPQRSGRRSTALVPVAAIWRYVKSLILNKPREILLTLIVYSTS